MVSFGNRDENYNYPIREAAYGLLMKDGFIALVSTPRGIFLPGGGIEDGEDHKACIERELQEELGMIVEVGTYVTTTRLTDVTPSRDYPIDMVGHCYLVTDTGGRVEAVEKDHDLLWLSMEEACYRLKLPHQGWVMNSLVWQAPKKTVVTYNPHWQWWYVTIESKLRQVLGNDLAIEHVGSTSIKDMLAKPVIDIDIVLEHKKSFHDVKSALEALGYRHMGNQGIDGREAFGLSSKVTDTTLNHIPHHLYVCNEDALELKRHLLFRNRLRADQELRNRYSQIKKSILDQVGPYDREAYVEMKANGFTEFFDAVLNAVD